MGSRYIFMMIGIILTLQVVFTYADGSLSYGDKCSVPNAILRVFANSEIDESQKCNSDQGLICTGTCTCPPTRVWDRGPLFGWFGGGSCIVGANGPCTKNDRCVPNAVCGDNFPICFCMDGYHAHELQCISSYGHNSASGSSSVKMTWFTYSILSLVIAKMFGNGI